MSTGCVDENKQNVQYSTNNELLVKAVQFHKKGKLDKAQLYYKKFLKMEPDHPDGMHLLGLAYQQKGQLKLAEKFIRKAIIKDGLNAFYHVNLGGILMQNSRWDDAEVCFKQSLKLNSKGYESYYNLGLIYQQREDWSQAETHFIQAIDRNRALVDAHNNLGIVYQYMSRIHDAISCFKTAIQLCPEYHAAYNNLGHALLLLEDFKNAQFAFEKAHLLEPGNSQYEINLAASYIQQGIIDVALSILNKVLEADKNNADAHQNIGSILMSQGEYPLAKHHFQAALNIRPSFMHAYNNLGNCWMHEGYPSTALEYLEKGLLLNESSAQLYDSLGNAYRMQGKIEQALSSFLKAVQIMPNYRSAYSNYLLTLNYSDMHTLQQIYNEHMQRCRYSTQTGVKEAANGICLQEKIKVAFLSPDLRLHSVSYFLQELFRNYARDRFEFICYADNIVEDLVSAQLKSLVDHWYNVSGISNAQLIEVIRKDKVLVLFDLTGHTGNNRLPVFDYPAAPIQVSYLGYPNTTGATNIQYRFTDQIADPPGAEQYYSEQLVHLPSTFLCYTPCTTSPPVAPLPALENGYVTFGSFNNLSKLNSTVIRLWSQILDDLAGSKILLKSKVLRDAGVQQGILSAFARNNISSSRVILKDYAADVGAHLADYSEVDIGLDPFPYNGTTTTFEALWMGVPVVSLNGDRHAGRVGASILQNLEKTEWLANSAEQYRRIAIQIATDPEKLGRVRYGLRETLQRSVLMDGFRFAQDFGVALETVLKSSLKIDRSD